MRFVVDTNTLISAILITDSVPFQALTKVRGSGNLLFSENTFSELESVLMRSKFDRYVSLAIRIEFLATIREEASFTKIEQKIEACRDSKDDQFLEAAVNGNAQFIITGDRDLLVLNPFREIEIISATQFLSNV